MALPSYATVSGTLTWSGGESFDGFVLLAVVPPTGYTEVRLNGVQPAQRVPLRLKVPIKDGAFEATAKIPYTTAYDPPNCKYAAWLFDSTNRQIAAPGSSSDFFTVTSSTWSPTFSTPSLPTASTTVPTLDT
jgi:hypothetical protein